MYKRDIYLDIDDNLNSYIKSVELDSNSRVWHFHLTVDYEPLDLTGKSVHFIAEKPDKTNVLNDCKIVDAEKGVVEVKLTRQVNAIPGHVKCLLKIIGDEGFVLKTKTFVVDVSKTLSDDAIVSSDEFGALEAALGKVHDIDNRFAQTNAQLSELANKGTTIEVLERVTKEEIDRQIADGTLATLTIEDGSIAGVKIKNNEIDVSKTTFIEFIDESEDYTPISIFNNGKISDNGYYANPMDGQIVSTQHTGSYKNTGYIESYENTRYLIKNLQSICYYDSNKVFISSITDSDWGNNPTNIGGVSGILVTTPKKCKYIIANFLISQQNNANLYLGDYVPNEEHNKTVIPSLKLNDEVIKEINGVLPIAGRINLTADNIGAFTPNSTIIATNLPFDIPNHYQSCSGKLELTANNGDDIIEIKTLNICNLNDYPRDVIKCDAEINQDGTKIKITTNSTFDGWFRCYSSSAINNLIPGEKYTFKCISTAISGYEVGENNVVTIFDNAGASLGQATSKNMKIQFTAPSSGEIEIRFYPKGGSGHSASTPLVCAFDEIQLYLGEDDIDFTPAYNRNINVNGKGNFPIKIYPSMNISSRYGLYNNLINIYKNDPVGNVLSVNNQFANEFGNIDLDFNLISRKKIVCFGDSITEFGTYPQQIGKLTGAITYNVGVGGTRMRWHPNNGYNQFSMTKLADAITTGDFTMQEQGVEEMKLESDDNSNQLALLKGINFNEIDYITIAFGTNDFGGSDGELGDVTSEKGINSFCGAIKYVIETILTTYPHIKLFFITPIYRWSFPNGTDSDLTTNKSGHYLNDYVQSIINICKMYHVPCLDLYNNSNINKINQSYYLSTDGVHPSDKGYELIAQKVSKFLISH